MKRTWVIRILFICSSVLFSFGAFSFHVPDEFALTTPGPVPFPKDNPYSAEKAELGRKLFAEGHMSKSGETPCTWCHDSRHGFTDGRTISIGDTKEALNRHSPSLYNVGYSEHLFWDGRSKTLEEQCLFPIKTQKEMNMDLKELPDRIRKAGYEQDFERAFGSKGVTVDRIAKALATYERTLTENNTPYDRWLKGDKDAMSSEAVAGLSLFKGKAGCITCHAGPHFSMAMTKGGFVYRNTGLYQSPVLDPDHGRMDVEKNNPDMDHAYKIPTLRGVGKHAPYMHNGTLATLEEVVDFYDRGGDEGKLAKLGLTPIEKKQLVAFLRNGITDWSNR